MPRPLRARAPGTAALPARGRARRGAPGAARGARARGPPLRGVEPPPRPPLRLPPRAGHARLRLLPRVLGRAGAARHRGDDPLAGASRPLLLRHRGGPGWAGRSAARLRARGAPRRLPRRAGAARRRAAPLRAPRRDGRRLGGGPLPRVRRRAAGRAGLARGPGRGLERGARRGPRLARAGPRDGAGTAVSATALPLVLASASPRRRELLARAGIAFEVLAPELPEEREPGEPPEEFAVRLAVEKALAVARRVGREPRRVVLAADTIVVQGEEVLGKPRDAAEAASHLRRLAGRRHRVLTAVAVLDSATLEARRTLVESGVAMRAASESEIAAYVATGEPLDKAGAYAAQGEGRRFVARIDGSETNVIGLPLEESLALLREAGVEARR